MKVEVFSKKVHELGIDTITGIPDSTLSTFCDYIGNEGKDVFFHHIVPENEGASIGIAIGEYLATGKPACVYMQNSGIGNIVNPITSLANREVYGIPMLLVIGWRGEPGIADEPQHKFMGKITKEILGVLDIEYSVIDAVTTEGELNMAIKSAKECFLLNKQYAFIIKKDTFEKRKKTIYYNGNILVREEVIGKIVEWLKDEDIVVSTTGKISRELYEQSDFKLRKHNHVFMSVGGMGHANMIAYQLSRRNPDKRVVCLDGDGALLMHMGSLAIIGKNPPPKFVHICLNNEAHESVGGMPTGAVGLSYSEIAKKSGYDKVYHIMTEDDLKETLREIEKNEETVFLEIGVAIGSRADLGRPKETAQENKAKFMEYNGVL